MVALAEAIAQRQEHPPRPVGAPVPATSPPPVPNLQPRPQRQQDMQQAPASPRTPGATGVTSSSGDVEDNGLSVPTSVGKWKDFDFTNRKPIQKVKSRMVLIHSGVASDQVEFEWISKKKLKFRIAWPEWFQYPEQMCKFHIDDKGDPVYRPDHPLTIDFAECNASITEEDGRVYDTGYIMYDVCMKTALEDLEHEILEIDIDSKGTKVLMLEITASHVCLNVSLYCLLVYRSHPMSISVSPQKILAARRSWLHHCEAWYW
jgi:hypothetical protein